MANTDYSTQYSDDGFWGKVKAYAKVAGKGVLEPALKMYYSATDPDTPRWAKTTIYGALGYFISPIDAIPDLLPVLGYTDDLGVLVAAMKDDTGKVTIPGYYSHVRISAADKDSW